MKRAWLGFGQAVAALAAVTAVTASAQTSWPSHPDIHVVQSFEPNDPRPEFPPAATVGLKWIGEGDPPIFWKSQRQVNKYGGLDAPGYDAIHSICLGGLPPPPDPLPPDYHYVVTWTGLPGDTLEGDGVTHHLDLCRAFFVTNAQTGFYQVTADVKIYLGSELLWHKKFYIDIAVVGGPLVIHRYQPASTDAYERHLAEHLPAREDDRKYKPDNIYPWYSTDFNYNPFLYRANALFRPNSLYQKVNVFQAQPVWPQPPGTRVWYTLDAPGVFVNYQENGVEALSSFGGSPNPRKTKGFPWTVLALVTSEPVQGSDDEFQLSAWYLWHGDWRHSDPGTLLDWEVPSFTTDESGKYYDYLDWLAAQPSVPGGEIGPTDNSIRYAEFIAHRPKSTHSYPQDSPAWQPPSGYSGGAVFYQLKDHRALGMPGVEIAERFTSQPPENVQVGGKWTTRKSGATFTRNAFDPRVPPGEWFHTFIQSSAVDGVFGPDYLVLSNWYWEERVPPLLNPYTLEWHQYWAGTSDVNNASQIGILVGEYRIVVHYLGTGMQEPDQWPGGGGAADPEEMRLEVLRTMFAQINQIPAGGQKE